MRSMKKHNRHNSLQYPVVPRNYHLETPHASATGRGMIPSEKLPIHLWFHHIVNGIQSLLLLGSMGALMAFLGWVIAGATGLLWVLIPGMALLLFTPKISPKLVMQLHKAQPLFPENAPNLYRMVGYLAKKAELPTIPQIYYIPSQVMNAFAVGNRQNCAIALTEGTLSALNPREITGVLAHEVAHIQNNDLWIMSLSSVVQRITQFLSSVGLFLLLINIPLLWMHNYGIPWLFIGILVAIPWLSILMQFALSRTREFHADLGAVRLTGDARGLASALDKIQRTAKL